MCICIRLRTHIHEHACTYVYPRGGYSLGQLNVSPINNNAAINANAARYTGIALKMGCALYNAGALKQGLSIIIYEKSMCTGPLRRHRAQGMFPCIRDASRLLP